ncbi:membrane-associated lipoprotein [Moorella thermoacetica Y72]|uniref:Membrane-associated lipoprotein n=1 Tax=Moorella thermoacetica Y72 TaxID=1325331 RepID=A0A0S6U891_NEOTH|nr:hypothetical protein [Moorella thermoacetica]GAF25218.1 membrane-associated lipoprotein [Moorella thermoacetica Y72]
MSRIEVKEMKHNKYGKCLELTNGIVDLIITIDTGPRVIRYGFIGRENEFCEEAPITLPVGKEEWRLMGGHRLWHSPEVYPRTYSPDNGPVKWSEIEGGVKVSQKVEPWVQIKKEMEITLMEFSSKVKIVHHLTNKNAWPVELAAWALTVMAPGGFEIVPQPRKDTGFLPNRVIVLWPYSRMNDPRVYWGERYILLKQDPKISNPFKFGIANQDGWSTYLNHGNLFIKRFNHQFNVRYPDYGISYETYMNNYMLEMESLSPLTLLEPEATVSHVEEWELIRDVAVYFKDEIDAKDEDILEEMIKKYIC